MTDERIYPVILSGGAGTRLWPVSRRMYPKQLLALTGDETLLQLTARRVGDPKLFRSPVLVTNDDHRFIIAEQLRLADIAPKAIMLEPEGRNTAPAAALAALRIAEREQDALMMLMPSDHVIADTDAFLDAVRRGIPAAREGRLVTFGVVPTRPETGYGYIEADGEGDCRPVARFVEKPDLAQAEEYLASGRFFWNGGMFLFTARGFLQELERHAPDILAACREAISRRQSDLDFERPDTEAFARCPSESIDYAVMEKTDRASVVPVDMGWSDIGSWSALWEIADRDADGNAAIGDVVAQDCSDCLLRAEGPAIAAVGLDDMVVVTTKDMILVAPKGRAQDVKSIVEQLKAAGRHEHLNHVTVHRPWGSYETTDRGQRFQTKRIVVKPGQKLSLQKHHHRAEHWVVVQGTAKVTRDDEEIMLSENESVYIPLGAVHRLENPGRIPLHLIEVQSGSYLGEDDIVRIEDTYGRG